MSNGWTVSTLTKTRDTYIAAIRRVLESRTERCDPGCPGWFVNHETTDVERCDECARANGYDREICDADVARLPEAIEARHNYVTEE